MILYFCITRYRWTKSSKTSFAIIIQKRIFDKIISISFFWVFLFFEINCLTNSLFKMLHFHRFKNYVDKYDSKFGGIYSITYFKLSTTFNKWKKKKCKWNRKLRRIGKNQIVKTNELKKLKINNDIVNKNVNY